MGCRPDIQNLSSDTMSHLNFASNDIQIIPFGAGHMTLSGTIFSSMKTYRPAIIISSSDSDSPEKMGLGAG
jgi:uncharacterized protein YjlB